MSLTTIEKNRTCSFHFIAAPGFLALGILFLLLANGCATAPISLSKPSTSGKTKPYVIMGKRYHPITNIDGFKQRGLASWYGRDFHGRKTANGEIYDMHAMTAAHKTLPLGTRIRVKNLKNNRTILVRVNDRGPFVRGRIVDLSYTGAKKLDMLDSGTAPVEIVALGSWKDKARTSAHHVPARKNYQTGNFTLQVGAFRERANAEKLHKELDKKYKNAHISDFDDGKERFYRVRVGKCSTLKKAMEYESILIGKGFKGAFIVAE